MAKELVTNEYIDRRAQLHNKWLKEAEDSYLTLGATVPYPDIPPYPTENDVVARAQALLKFLLDNNELVSTVAGTSDKSTMAIGEIVEPAAVAPEPILVEELCTGPTGTVEAQSNNTCTAPTGAVDSSSTSACTGPTGAEAAKEDKDLKSKSKGRIPMPPDEYFKYAKIKLNQRDQEEVSEFSRVIPDLVKALRQPPRIV